MVNEELARIFKQIADLLEIEGEDTFRINSYRRVSRALEDLTDDVAMLAERGQLQKVPGIGKGSVERIQQYLAEGKIAIHEELLTSMPAGLLRLLDIPGVGPKKVGALYRELGVDSIEKLQAAIAQGEVEALSGFGKKSAEKILEGIAFLASASGRIPLGIAWDVAEGLRQQVAGLPGVKRAEVAGSLRRGRETIGDLDLLCEAEDGKTAIAAFTSLDEVVSVRAAGDTKATVMVNDAAGGQIQVDLRVVPVESFGAAWQYFTGSKEHNVRLREIAAKKGWKLNEYGLFDGEKQLAGKDEQSIYRKLGFKWMVPEAREDRGEIEAKGDVPELVELKDIQGDLHVHTTASDGRCSIEKMAEAAKQRGYQYLAITDHSRSSVIANGLSMERLEKHVEAIRAADKKIKGITLLAGIECDILADGKLDYSDDVLAELDWVVASIHSAQGQSSDKVTKRTIAAMENPHIDAIGHPSGRLIGRRDAMSLEWEKVFEAAARTRTALEVNASWQRLDLKDVHIRQALEGGCWLCINTDAHDTDQLDQMLLGIITARRGWATADRIVNCLSVGKLKKWLAGDR